MARSAEFRYMLFDAPGQATWQPGPSFLDGCRVVVLSMEPRRRIVLPMTPNRREYRE